MMKVRRDANCRSALSASPALPLRIAASDLQNETVEWPETASHLERIDQIGFTPNRQRNGLIAHGPDVEFKIQPRSPIPRKFDERIAS
jgi:hypothetical protein